MTVLALNAGRPTVSAAVPPDSGTVPSVTTWPLCGPLDSLSANTTDPVAADGVTVAVSVTGVPNLTDPADTLSAADGAITSETASVAVWLPASVTLTVKENVPATVGVPPSTPLDAPSVIPACSAPALTDHAYGATPPLADNVSEYATPICPGGGAGKPRPSGPLITDTVLAERSAT